MCLSEVQSILFAIQFSTSHTDGCQQPVTQSQEHKDVAFDQQLPPPLPQHKSPHAHQLVTPIF